MYEEWGHEPRDPGDVQVALLRFRQQEDGRMVSFLHGKAVLLDKKHLGDVAEGEWWIVSLDHRETFAIGTPVERFDAAAYLRDHPEVVPVAELLPTSAPRDDAPLAAAQPPLPAPQEVPATVSGYGLTAEEALAVTPDSWRTGPSGPHPAPGPPRVALFVDSANMNFACKRVGYFIDWRKAAQHFSRDRRFTAAYFYIGVHRDVDEAQQGFLDFLSHNGYIVRRKAVKTGHDHDTGEEFRKANLDIEVVLDMVNTSDNWDVAVLFSGDSDFERAVELLRSRGKRVEVVASRTMLSRELAYVADKPIHFLEELEGPLARGDRRPGDRAAPLAPADDVWSEPATGMDPERASPR